jgi:hypothetical protein
MGLEGEHFRLSRFKPREKRYEQFGKPATKVGMIESGREWEEKHTARATEDRPTTNAGSNHYTRIIEHHNSYILVTF